jgi:5'-3' exonuclease
MTTNNETFIFIDGSYFCFYRYHSLVNWWRNAFPEQLDVLQNPYANTIFVDKFKKIFLETLEKLPKNLSLNLNSKPTIIIGKDCKRNDIWRNVLLPSYKGTRDNIGFMGGPFFQMVYEEQLFVQGGASCVLNYDQLEADDCIAISVKYLLQTYPQCQIYIITSDKDYLQLSEPRVHLYNLAFKNLIEQKSSYKNADCDLFCKILTGDPSDNITSVFPKCGPKTALKYYENRELLAKKLQESELYQQKYELNQTLIDFNCIPSSLADGFLEKWQKQLKYNP